MHCVNQILSCDQHYFYRRKQILRGEFRPVVDQQLEDNLHKYIKEVRNHPSSCKPLLLRDVILPLYTNSLCFKELFDLLANMVNDLIAVTDNRASKHDMDRPSSIDMYTSAELTEIYWKDAVSLGRGRIQIDQNTTLASFTRGKLVLILGTAVYLLNKLWVVLPDIEQYRREGASGKDRRKHGDGESCLYAVRHEYYGNRERDPRP